MLSKVLSLDCHVHRFGIQRKRESRRQANEAQREKRARDKRQRRDFFLLEEQHENFVAAVGE